VAALAPGPEGRVERLREGMPGHRLRVPEKMHPYSAGIKGGIVGGLVMPIPAFIYCHLSGHTYWYPINLLAGILLPNLGQKSISDLEQFNTTTFVLGTIIHGVTSIGVGLMYGVLLPTLPGRPIVWGGLVAPLLWTGAIHSFMGVLNPALQAEISKPSVLPWF